MKKHITFRIEEHLIEKLKEKASQQHRSLNNYIEYILSKVTYSTKEELEDQALLEFMEKVDTSDTVSEEEFLNSLND